MFGSQVLDTAVGLVLVLVVVSQAASAVVDWVSRMLAKRSRDLEATIAEMLTAAGTTTLTSQFTGTSVYRSATAAVRRSHIVPWGGLRRGGERPTYLPAAAFATAVIEMLATKGVGPVLTTHEGLATRLSMLVQEGAQDIVDLKAGLETWFDDTMARLQEAYKRWATTWLLVAGLAIALAGNVSMIGVAQSLWSDSIARDAVVAAAGNVRDQSAPPSTTSAPATPAPVAPGNPVTEVSEAVRQAQSYSLPVGWGSGQLPPWSSGASLLIWLAGGLITGLLTTLGAPFWFDLLTRLLALRGGGVRPVPAPADPTSATVTRAARGPGQLGPAAGPGTLEDQLGALIGPLPQRAPDPPPPTASSTR